MRLTTFTDYCLRVLIYVGMKDGEVVTIDEISQRYGISRNHVMKVVLRLSQHDYLTTARGKGGGMWLARKPEEINIGTLVRQMEEDLALVECFQPGNCACIIEPACMLRKALHEALESFFAVLDGYTLANFLEPKSKLARLLSLTA